MRRLAIVLTVKRRIIRFDIPGVRVVETDDSTGFEKNPKQRFREWEIMGQIGRGLG
jgi:hypothetical protein